MCVPSSHFAVLVTFPDLDDESVRAIAPRAMRPPAFLASLRPRLCELCGEVGEEAAVFLSLAGGRLGVDEPRSLQELMQGDHRSLELCFEAPGPAAAAYAMQRKEAHKVFWSDLAKSVGEEFGIDSAAIDVQLASRRTAAGAVDPGEANGRSFVLVASLAGEVREIITRSFDDMVLSELVAQAAAEFSIPAGGADLVWGSRRLAEDNLGQTLQDIGLISGERLTLVRRDASPLLAFLARLRVIDLKEATSGHGLGFTSERHIRFSVSCVAPRADPSATFEIWVAESETDGYCECTAQILRLHDEAPPACLLQLKFDENWGSGTTWDVFQALAPALDDVASVCHLPDGLSALRALSCAGLPVQARSMFHDDLTPGERGAWDVMPVFSDVPLCEAVSKFESRITEILWIS